MERILSYRPTSEDSDARRLAIPRQCLGSLLPSGDNAHTASGLGPQGLGSQLDFHAGIASVLQKVQTDTV